MQAKKDNQTAILRLTALWGLTESGLGGWMHALHLPFTGLFVGGCAIAIISLISYYSNHNIPQVLKATLLVILVKFTASPQTPWMAYIAVGFQGLAGALLLRAIPNFTVASILFSIFAMLESALQKLLLMMLIYGNPLWQAIDDLFRSIAKTFSLPTNLSFSYWLIWGYILLYVVWGLLLGIWIHRLPRSIENSRAEVKKQLHEMQGQNTTIKARKKGKIKPIIPAFILLGIAGIFLLGNEMDKAAYAIFRTIAALLLVFAVINPLVNMLLRRWLIQSKSRHKESLAVVLGLLPSLQRLIKPSYTIAAKRHKGYLRYPAFLLILLVATLYSADESPQDIYTDTSGK